ncbi:MAG TPA: phosphopantetheine-binding protein, partial [Polyangiaceae bacterium]|nr:phosphopantetheine-binding protein [Polyangiaceae bacterium]
VAYVTGRAGERAPEPEALRAALARSLPAAMLPWPIRVLDAMPLSPNGKLDRGALPALGEPREAPARSAAPPRTELERTIATIWQEVLPVGQVGVDDNFFDLGGHSLLLTRVHHRLREATQQAFPMLLLFQHPTVASLAAALSGAADGAPPESERGRERARVARDRRAELFARRRGGRETAE